MSPGAADGHDDPQGSGDRQDLVGPDVDPHLGLDLGFDLDEEARPGRAGARRAGGPGGAPARTVPPMGLPEAFAELGAIRLGETSLTDVLVRVAVLAQASIPGADEVSVTMVDGERAGTVTFTGPLAVQLDERQYEDGFGPCLDAARGGGTVPLLDLASEQRYPGFVSAAVRAGVVATVSVGLPVPGRVVGGLNVYRLGSGPAGQDLDEASVRAAEHFAGYAAVAVANAGLVRSAQQYAEQMREAMATRATIEQAKGVLVARTGCTPDEAFALMSAESSRTNRKLVLVAAELVAQAQGGRPSS